MFPPVVGKGAFAGGKIGASTGAFVGGFIGTTTGDGACTGAFIGGVIGATTGALTGADIGAPVYNTSIPLICGFCLFRTKSIVMAVSFTKVGTATM